MRLVSLIDGTNAARVHIHDITTNMFLRVYAERCEDINDVIDCLLDQEQLDKVKTVITRLVRNYRTVYQFDTMKDMEAWERRYQRYR